MLICKTKAIFVSGFMALLFLAGCSTVPLSERKTVQPGDWVTVNYTCYLSGGELAESTSKESSFGAVTRKSPIYVPRTNDVAVALVAGVGVPPAETGPPPEEDFEFVLNREAAKKVVGREVGETFNADITVERRETHSGRDYKLRMNRVWHRPKQLKMTQEEFRSRLGEPVIGKEYPVYNLIRGKVEKVEDGDVHLVLTPEARHVELDYGPAEIREASNFWDICIEPEIGRLVRIGPMVGKIEKKNDRTFVVDFGHPFGGEDLSCDIRVKKIIEKKGGKDE